MRLKSQVPKEDLRLEIIQQRSGFSSELSYNHWSSNLFQPQKESTTTTPSGSKGSKSKPSIPAPEKKLTLFAMRLAILEKAASSLGTLGFLWATTVLLGGFATTLKTKDFWIITTILLTESTRIYGRSHELEWQHETIASPPVSAEECKLRHVIVSSFLQTINVIFKPVSSVQSDSQQSKLEKAAAEPQNNILQYRTERTWHSSEVPFLPCTGWISSSRNISRILFWLQLSSALVCATLSSMRLIQQHYSDGDGEQELLQLSLNVFYGLALTEALVFLMEKAYGEWKTGYNKLLERVCEECNLGDSGMVSIKRFFCDSYSRCIKGSIFDGLKMDLISFAEEMLESDCKNEQLNGIQIIQSFVTDDRFAAYTLQKIGTTASVIERLIEMLNWKNPSEAEIRRSAAELVSMLAGKKQNAIHVAEIPGALESISSLLYTGHSYDPRPHEVSSSDVVQADYDFLVFNLLGLLILKKLAHNQDNCNKIGNVRGLMPKIVDFTNANENLLRNDQALESHIKKVKRSLQLVKMLVSTTGQTGKMMRKEISEIVFTVSNIRELLKHGERHMVLQKLGIEILTNLALDEEAREKIGSTGGVLSLLLSIFFKPRQIDDQNTMYIAEAGEALAVLALESNKNCNQILKEDNVVGRLIGSLTDPVLQVNSTRILRNLCAYSGPECSIQLKEITAAAPTVLKAIMVEKEKLLEASIGLAAQIFRFTTPEGLAKELRRGGIKDAEFAKQLVEILKGYNYPDNKVPRIRRHIIELAIWMMRSQGMYIQLFKKLAADDALKCVAETTSELENFNVFSGSIGLSRINTTLLSLIDAAVELMAQCQN